MEKTLADSINILGAFCGKRDVDALTPERLKQKYQIDCADVMVLFGGSILCGGDVLASAMRHKVARSYLIVGGEGHTTQTLRRIVHERYPAIITEGKPEAEVFQHYLKIKYGLEADCLETQSTNCGNNITNMLSLLRAHRIACSSIILCQDATMQYRMEAGLRKCVSEDVRIINYAAYHATVAEQNNGLCYSEEIPGMWEMRRYVELLMGEIVRLSDDANGYGPNGKNYIAHVDIPDEVWRAYELVKEQGGIGARKAL